MDNIIAQLLKVNPPDITFVNVITWVVHCVEIYSQGVQSGKGSSKFAIFKQSVPVFINQAVALNLCTQAHGAEVLAAFDKDWQTVSDIVTALINVAHSPQFVQLEADAKACFAKCKKQPNGK